jgi:hypothetical protein
MAARGRERQPDVVLAAEGAADLGGALAQALGVCLPRTRRRLPAETIASRTPLSTAPTFELTPTPSGRARSCSCTTTCWPPAAALARRRLVGG